MNNRSVYVLLTLSFGFAACPGPSSPSTQPGARISSVVTLQGETSANGQSMSASSPRNGVEREPNSDAFFAEDLGAENGEVRGTVGAGDDKCDCFRIGFSQDGAAKILVEQLIGRIEFTVYHLAGGRAPVRTVAHRLGGSGGQPVLGTDLAIPVRATDHLIVAIQSAARASYQLNVNLSSGVTVAQLPTLSMDSIEVARESLLPQAHETFPGEIIMVLPDADVDEQLALATRFGYQVIDSGGSMYRLKSVRIAGFGDTNASRLLVADDLFELRRSIPGVEVSPNYTYRATLEPNDTYFDLNSYSWGHAMANVPAAWDQTTGNGTVTVAVLDTGVMVGHPDLEPNMRADGYDFVDDDDDPRDLLRAGATFHGTHVAGIVGAATDNAMGIAGVGWNTRILPLRVLGPNGGSSFDIAQAILYAAGLANSSGRVLQDPARIINMSLSSLAPSSAIEQAVKQATESGAILVAAAGNARVEGSPTKYPAAFPDVIAVASAGPSGNGAYYSNIGSYVDITAPGGDQSTRLEDGYLSTGVINRSGQWYYSYVYKQGTSMAAPFLSGVVALMLSVNEGLTTNRVREILAQTATDLGQRGKDDEYGHGMVNAAAAVRAANIGLTVNAYSVHFGKTGSAEARVQVGDNGSAIGLELSMPKNVPWLSATLDGTYTPAQLILRVDRAQAFGGVNRGTVTLKTSQGEQPIEVTLEAPIPDRRSPAVVLLMNSDGSLVRKVTADSAGAFEFVNIPIGDYELLAGLDSNANESFDDVGDWTTSVKQVSVVSGDNALGPMTALYNLAGLLDP